MPRPLIAVYTCEACGQETEGSWRPPQDQDDEVPAMLQACPCGNVQMAAYPGYAFRTEAG